MAEFAEDFLEPSLEALPDEVRLAVVDFSASWCGPCKRQDPMFKRLARAFCDEAPDEPVRFLLVDVDKNQPLARSRHVKSVPTTLILAKEDGLLWGQSWREKARFTGVVPYPTLKEAVDERLDDIDDA